ncbi:30S ribosomal protein S3 [Candidatus Woesearchaeota archaeon]|nr:30S ribosomal protein S3 [Candidatus Woesearchaeota archaeon]
MIERKLLGQRVREFQVHEFIASSLKNVGYSHTKIIRTPLGEKIMVYASRPGLVVGRKGENIKKLTATLKKKFKFENPEIELQEVENPEVDAQIVAERIASSLERFGTQRFKGIGHKALSDVMSAGARGIEVLISGKVPSARAKTWRFYSGYLKKSGDASISQVKRAFAAANLKSGTIGIRVAIMPQSVKLPDDMSIIEKTAEQKIEEEKKQEEKPAVPEESTTKEEKTHKRQRKKKSIEESEKAESSSEEKRQKRSRKKTSKEEPVEEPRMPEASQTEVKVQETEKLEDKKEEVTEETK